MDRTGIKYFNSYYIESTEAVFKIIEIIFGAGAWGPVITLPGPYTSEVSFFLWASFSGWILVLLSYLVQLCKVTAKPSNPEEWKEYFSPRLTDLFMNAFIAFLYFPSTIVFCEHLLPLASFLNNYSIFVAVMAIATFLIHLFHASALVIYFKEGEEKWKTGKRWIWQKPGQLKKITREATIPGRYETPLPLSTKDVVVQQDHEIYQDLS